MDRNTVIRWVVIAAVIIVFWKWVIPGFTGKSNESKPSIAVPTLVDAPGFSPDRFDPGAKGQEPTEGELCTIQGNRFRAELSARGAGLRHLWLTDARYAGTESEDMS